MSSTENVSVCYTSCGPQVLPGQKTTTFSEFLPFVIYYFLQILIFLCLNPLPCFSPPILHEKYLKIFNLGHFTPPIQSWIKNPMSAQALGWMPSLLPPRHRPQHLVQAQACYMHSVWCLLIKRLVTNQKSTVQKLHYHLAFQIHKP